MHSVEPNAQAQATTAGPAEEASAPQGRGWYLYGIIQQPKDRAAGTTAPLRHSTDEVQLLEHAGLAAVVRSVPLAEYDPAALRARLQDAAWLEIMARHHHETIESIHQLRAILPSKFGCVCASDEDLRGALAEMKATLLTRLEYVADCDEWTVRLYADRPTLERRLAESHPVLQSMQREVAQASSGRAYLLKRRMADELNKVVEQAARDRAQATYEHLSRQARAGTEQTAPSTAGDRHGERELLRAVFLVPRTACAAFLDAVDGIAMQGEGLRGESSGPWPPYSFATLAEE